jgi:phosphatidylglycerol---prolipoprotein diacylglyceryl transferase
VLVCAGGAAAPAGKLGRVARYDSRLPIPWHFLFESLAYMAGFALYQRARTAAGDFLSTPNRSSVIVAAIVGAAVFSKVLGWFEDPDEMLRHWREPAFWLGGKTIVGALLGGTVAVEWAKARLGIHERTGDLFAVPLCAGMAVGRIGCFLAGLDDHTYGIATSLPWGVDFGDGIRRHPTQLYDIAFLALLILLLKSVPARRRGDHYRLFLFSYCAWRLAVDFLKPAPTFAGLATLQWVCLAAVIYYGRDVQAMFSGRRNRGEINQHG